MGNRSPEIVVLVSILGVLGVAGDASADTKKLGTFGGWAISLLRGEDGKFQRCVADTTGSSQNHGLRLSFAADGKRHFIMPGPGTPSGTKDQATVVLLPSGKTFTFTMVQGNPNRLWSPVLGNDFTDVFFASKRMEVNLPARNLKRAFNLGDPDTMSARIDGCITSDAAEAPPANPAPGSGAGAAAFCQQYAAAVSTAAKDAIAINPACQDFSKGVHAVSKAHVEWCQRTEREKVEGASAHIRRLASQCTQGALAAPTEYGGYNIVGNDKFERPYGKTGPWEVRAALSGQTFMYCVAESNVGGRKVRLGVDLVQPGATEQWQVAVPMKGPKDWQGSFQVDGKGFGNGGGNQMGGVGVNGWSIAWLGAAEVDGLRKGGREGLVGVGTQDYEFSLDGVAAAIRKIEECRARKGVAG